MRVDQRNVAIEHIQVLAEFRIRALKDGIDPLATFRDLVARTEPREAFRALRALDQKLAALSDDEIFRALG